MVIKKVPIKKTLYSTCIQYKMPQYFFFSIPYAGDTYFGTFGGVAFRAFQGAEPP